MKAFVTTHKRDDIKTLDFLDDEHFDVHVVVHNQEEADRLASNGYEHDPLVTNQETGKYGQLLQQNYIYTNYVDDGEWFLVLDDDIGELLTVEDKYYDNESNPVSDKTVANWNEAYGEPMDSRKLRLRVDDKIEKADSLDICYAGFSPLGNPFFRNKKWLYRSPITNGLRIWKKDETIPFPTHLQFHMEDIFRSAEYMYRDGRILTNCFCYVKNEIFQPETGFAVEDEERLQMKAEDCDLLINEYSEEIMRPYRFKVRNEFPAVSLRRIGPKRIEAWRKNMAEKRGDEYTPKFAEVEAL